MSHHLKSLLPTILLLAIYFIADEFLGPVAGSLTALVLGTLEFLYTRIRQKIYDRMILWTTLLFCLPGIITIFSTDTLANRLQPVLIETGLCILSGIFAFSQADPTSTLPASYRKNLHFSEQQLKNMRHSLKILFYLLILHTVLSYLAIWFVPEPTADFINSKLLYILLGTYFIFLFIRNRYVSRRMKKEEWLPVVNEKGEIIGQAPRSVCHSGSKLIHPVVHLHITNPKQEFFLQKRSMKKDLLPGKWDTAVGGHVGLNEKIEDALKRETFEELGITDFEARFLGSYIWESPSEKELVFSFLCTRYNRMNIDNDEVDEGKFWTLQEIEQGIRENTVTPNFAHEYSLLLHKIKN